MKNSHRAILHRRKVLAGLLMHGIPRANCAAALDVTERTVRRDIAWLRRKFAKSPGRMSDWAGLMSSF